MSSTRKARRYSNEAQGFSLSDDGESEGRAGNSMDTVRPRGRRPTLETQPLHVGFDIDPPSHSSSGATGLGGGPIHYPNGNSYRSSFDMRNNEDRERDNGYAHDVTLDGSRRSEGYEDGLSRFIGGKADEQDGVGEALVRMKRRRYIQEAMVTGLFVLGWYLFATLLSLYNKWMFSPQYYNFPFPLFVTMLHQIVQFLLAFAVRRIWPSMRPKERPAGKDYVEVRQKVVPTAMTTGLDIGLSNLSLKTITLTLYTMCKSSTLIFVLIFAFLFRLEAYSLRLVLVISCISIGVFLMVFNATTVSIPGIIMVFTASAMGGLRWALTQLVMHKKEMGMGNPYATIYWLAPVMAGTLGFVSLIIEGWGRLFESDHFEGVKAVQTVGFILAPGAIAFAMVASEYHIIQRAGVVPLSIAGIFKEVSTIGISSWIFGDQLTPLNEVGVVVAVAGIAMYSYHKYQKSVHGGSNSDDPGARDERDAQVPLFDAEEGNMPMTMTGDRRRSGGRSEERVRREEGNNYILGDDDEEEEGASLSRQNTHNRHQDHGEEQHGLLQEDSRRNLGHR